MRPALAAVLTVSLLAGAAPVLAGDAADAAQLDRLLKDARSKSSMTRLPAYDALIELGPAGVRALLPILREAERRAAADFEACVKSPAAAGFRKWLKKEIVEARKEALALIRDRNRYPDDAHGEVGQPLVDAAVSRLRAAWLRPGRMFRERAPDVNERLYFVKEAADYLRKAGLETETWPNLEEAIDDLDEWLDARGTVTSSSDRKEIEEVLEYNDAAPSIATDEERRYARVLNEYRWMLGLEPLELDDRLIAAARKHSQEMYELDYFAHESPVAENKSPDMRAAREGFHGGVGENCAVANDAQGAFDGWYTSSGHHRLLVSSSGRQLGIGQSKREGGAGGQHWTMMVGSSDSLRSRKKSQNPRQVFAARRAALRAGDAETRFQLARFCRKNEMFDEERQLLLEIVALEPGHVKAHRLLGHVRSGERWLALEDKIREELQSRPEAEVLGDVLTLLGDAQASRRVAAVAVLESMSVPEAPAALRKALADDASEVRVAACDALAARGAPENATALVPLLGDPVFYVRHAAAHALVRLADTSGVPVLFKGLRSGDLNVRIDAHRRAAAATGRDFGYAWDLPDVERAKVVDQWEEWWAKEGRGAAAK